MKKEMCVGYVGKYGNAVIMDNAVSIDVDDHEIMSYRGGNGFVLISGHKDVVEERDGYKYVFSDSAERIRKLLLESLARERDSLLEKVARVEAAIASL